MAIYIKANCLNSHCRTCLKENNEEKYKLNELPDSLYQLVLQCIGAECMLPCYPDSICEQCYDSIKNFDNLQIQTRKSNDLLKNILEEQQGKINCVEIKETVVTTFGSNDDDPLNCTEHCEIKYEPTAEEVSTNEVKTMQNDTNIEAEFIKTVSGDLYFTATDNTEAVICKYGCGKTFRRVSTLKAHYRIKHLKQENASVSSCKMREAGIDSGTNNSGLDDEDWQKPDPKDIKADMERKFVCKICHRKYTDKSTLRVHERLHLDKLPFQCEKCERSFNKKIRLTKHMKERHAITPLALECKYGCGKTFNRYHALDNHHHKHRTNTLDLSGDIIESKKSHKANVRRKQIAPKEAYVCEDCGQVLPNVSKLRQHSYRHRPPEERPFKCEHCHKTFIVKRSYDEHLMRHAGIRKFECHICGWKASTRREVVKHMNIHTKESKVNCVICSKAYADPKTLKRHIETVHQGMKKYNCRYCDKTFAKCDVRNRHEMEHGAERPYKCKLCDESFFLLAKLSSHTSSAHNNTTTISTAADEENSSMMKLQDINQILENIC